LLLLSTVLGKQFTNAGPGDSKIFEMSYEIVDPVTSKTHSLFLVSPHVKPAN